MKRFLTIMLVLMMLFNGVAAMAEGGEKQNAEVQEQEEFVLRNGIKFGMSSEEVFKLESEYGVELRNTTGTEVYNVTADGVKVLGNEGCSLYYNFAEDDKMDSMVYYLTGSFDEFYTYLGGKYGQPLIDRYGQFLDIGKAPDAKEYIDRMWIDYFGFEASNANYTQWWHPVGEDGYVDILLMRVNLTRSTTTNRYTLNILSYTYRTNEEKESILADIKAEAERTKDDL